MWRILYYLVQPGVVTTGLIGTAMQVGLGVANNANLGGIADTIANYGLSGQLASGGLIAAVTGLIYSFTQRRTGQAIATGAGGVAGGISGTLGTGINQAIGITPVAADATPILDFPAIGAALMAAAGMSDPSQPQVPADQMFDALALGQVFGTTAMGGGVGAFLGRFVAGRK